MGREPWVMGREPWVMGREPWVMVEVRRRCWMENLEQRLRKTRLG